MKPTRTGEEVRARLEQLAKGARRSSTNARTLAAMADNPACHARRLLDAAGIDKTSLARTVGRAPLAEQSPFAIVCPKNTSLFPTARVVDVERQVRALRRMLANRESIDEILDRLEDSANLGMTGLDEKAACAKLDQVLDATGTNYVPGCLGSCSLAYHCRERARTAEDPACLGQTVRASLGAVQSLSRVLELADGAAPQDGEEDVASMLVQARRFLEVVG